MIAQELRDEIEKLTGAKLEVITDASSETKNLILIGPTKLSPQPSSNFADPEIDFFEIRFSNGNLAIVGNRRGISSGTYELLEKFGGVRYYASWMYVYPKPGILKVPEDVNIISSSSFIHREFYNTDFEQNIYYCARSRMNTPNCRARIHGGPTTEYYGSESFKMLMTSDEYPKSKYPERFALLADGRRSDAAPCLSHPLTFQIFMKRIEADLNNGEVYLIDVSQFDTGDHCLCKDCMDRMKKYGDRYSGVNLEFINKIATALEKTHPKVLIRTFAWDFTRKAPKNIKAHKNVIIRFAAIDIDYGHPIESPINNDYFTDIKEWQEVADKFYVWDYTTNFNHIMGFHPNYHVIAPNIKTYAKYNFTGFYSEDSNWFHVLNNTHYNRYHNDMEEYRGYMTTKLLWNPNANPDYIEDEFLYGFYGPSAAPYVKQILNETKSLMMNDYANNWMGTYHAEIPNFIPEEYADHMKRIWDMAIKASEDDKDIDPRFNFNAKMGQLASLYVQYIRNSQRTKTPTLVNGKVMIEGNDKLVNAVRTILGRCPGPYVRNETSQGVCAMTYRIRWELELRYLLNQYAYGVDADIIKNSDITAVSAGQSVNGGKIISLKKKNMEFLNPEEGIYFHYFTETKYIYNQVLLLDYKLQSKTSTSTTYKLTEDNVATTTKTYTATSTGLNIDINYARMSAGAEMRPLFMITLNFSDPTFIGYKIGNKEWKSHQLMNNMEFDHCGGTLDKADKVIIMDPATKKGVEIKCPNYFESVVIHMNRTSKKIRVSIVGDYVTPSNTYNVNHRFVVTPYETITGAPTFQKAADTTTHDSKVRYGYAKGDKFIFPDFMMNYLNQGLRRSVSDPQSPTGTSARFDQGVGKMILFYVARDNPYYILSQANYTTSMLCKCVEPNPSNPLAGYYGYVRDIEIDYTLVYQYAKDYTDNAYKEVPLKNPTPIYSDTHFIISNKFGGCKYLHLSQVTMTVVDPPKDYVPREWPEEHLEKMQPPNITEYNQTDDKDDQTDGDQDPKSKKWVPAVIVVAVLVVIAIIAVAVFFVVKKKKNESNEGSDPAERNELDMNIMV
ncbi:hypothetical protein TVAG_250930 [Trichomonas vaginalis G3]|uniref:Uncharacterized protein n=1 Tax=Trichomonas vaginalis (strain ATCC PRA-98 / G3) TaxID=412133 RepID=A2FJJ5_TRIV3|nr:coagulation factor 5/8 C-terminal domain-containing protein family [Trichomonas vaginalis G3]EAX94927.1 hypothetical protein TVAG_250930 [Trichomonas vaginalis G3]KAI5529780.1 coagulation factor 5/8 C-terminal domain-containing protein family [Trichomonas vaginalis G3]|eukprot:XP_001307857.1 hypothetical protein [Trichomonas vaginalis G3]